MANSKELDDAAQRKAKLAYAMNLVGQTRLVKSAKTFGSEVQAFANWWDRLLTAYLQVGEHHSGPHMLMPSSWNDQDYKTFTHYYNSPVARDHRYASLNTFDTIGRMMYTAGYLGKKAFDYPEDAPFTLGREVGYIFKNQHLLERIKNIANSQEAQNYVNDHAALMVDLPASLIMNWYNPIFAAIARTPEWAQYLYRDKQINEMLKIKDVVKLTDFVDRKFSVGIIEPEQMNAILNAVEKGDRLRIHQMLAASNMQRPSVADAFQIDALRRPLERFSSAQRELLSKTDEGIARINAEASKRWAENPKLMDFAKTATSKELHDFAMMHQSQETMQGFIQSVMKGEPPAMSPKTLEALKEWYAESKYQIRLANKYWESPAMKVVKSGRIEKRLEEISRLFDEKSTTAADRIAELLKLNQRDLAPQAPEIQHYFANLRHEAESMPGQALPRFANRERSWIHWKEESKKAMLEGEPLREKLVSEINRLQSQVKAPMKEGAFKLMRQSAMDTLERLQKETPEYFGSAANKTKMLDGWKEIVKLAEHAGNPKEQSFVVKFLDSAATSLKQLKFYGAPIAHGSTLWLNNWLKAIAATSGRVLTRIPTAGRLTGEALEAPHFDFTKVGREEWPTLFDTPILRNLRDTMRKYAIDPAKNNAMEASFRVAYHDKADEMAKTFPLMTIKAIDEHALNHAKQFATKNFFFVGDGMEPAYTWAERLLPGTFIAHPAHNVGWAIDYFMQHPQIAQNLLNVGKTISEKYNIDSTGHVALPGMNVSINAERLGGLGYGLDKIMGINIPEAGKDGLDTFLKYFHAADAGANQFLSDPLHNHPVWSNLDRLIKGEMPSLIKVAPDEATRRQQRDALYALNGPLYSINNFSKMVSGKDLAGNGFEGPAARDLADRAMDYGSKKEMVLAQLRGEDITQRDAEERWHYRQVVDGLGKQLGIDLKVDTDSKLQRVNDLIDFGRHLPSRQMRNDWYNYLQVETPEGPKPLLKGLWNPNQIPDEHESADYMKAFERAKGDPVKARELFNQGNLEQKKGIFENLGTEIMLLMHKTMDKAADLLTMGHEAHGDDWDVPPNIAKDPTRTTKEYQAAYPKNDQASILPVGRIAAGGKEIQWLDNASIGKLIDGTMNSNDLKKSSQLNENLNTALRFYLFRAAHSETADSYKAAYEGKVTLPNGTTFDPAPFFGKPGNPTSRLAQTLIHITSQGEKLPDGTQNFFSNPAAYPLLYEAIPFLTDGKIPDRITRKEAFQVQQKNLELSPWLRRITESTGRPGAPDPDQVNKEINDNIGKPGGPPQDLYRRLMDGGHYADLANFAMNVQGSPKRLAALYSSLHTWAADPDTGRYNYQISESAVNSAIHQGMGTEVQLLGMRDPNVRRILEDLGHPTNAEAIRSEAFMDFLAKNNVPLKQSDPEKSAMIIPFHAVPYVDQTGRKDQLLPASLIDTSQIPMRPKVGEAPVMGADFKVNQPINPPQVKQPPVSYVQPTPEFESTWALPQPPPGGFRSTTEFIHFSANASIQANKALEARENFMRQEGDANHIEPRYNIFSAGAQYLPHLDPTIMAQGAEGIMHLGNQLGFVPNEAMRDIRTGIAQAQINGEAANLSGNLLAIAGNFTSAMSAGKRLLNVFGPSTSTAPANAVAAASQAQAQMAPDIVGSAVENAATGTGTAAGAGVTAATSGGPGMMSYAGGLGSLLSIASGVNTATGGDTTASKALGTAGGALQGAAMGSQVGGPVGAVVGGIFGAATGFFSSGNQGGRRDTGPDFARAHAQYLQSQAQQSARLSGSMAGNVRALNSAFAGGTQLSSRAAMPQMLNYFRRPAYWTMTGNQGLVRSVEGSIQRTLQPRF